MLNLLALSLTLHTLLIVDSVTGSGWFHRRAKCWWFHSLFHLCYTGCNQPSSHKCAGKRFVSLPFKLEKGDLNCGTLWSHLVATDFYFLTLIIAWIHELPEHANQGVEIGLVPCPRKLKYSSGQPDISVRRTRNFVVSFLGPENTTIKANYIVFIYKNNTTYWSNFLYPKASQE